ncbi:MAG: hypothetical protein QM722_15050 [Piscinibacter sp.]
MDPMQSPYAMQPGAQQPMQGQLSPELVQAILQLQQQNAAQGAIGRQRKRAESLLQSGADQMQGQMVGPKGSQVYVPPNLANLGASLFSSYAAHKAMNDADLREQNMGVQHGDALRRYFEAMSGAAPRRMGHMGDEGE